MKIKKSIFRWLWLAAAIPAMLLTSCGGGEGSGSFQSGNAVYFWKKTFSLSQKEKQFLADNNIHTLYVKFFDVVVKNGTLFPEATLLFKDTFPEATEIIPTVFLEPEAFRKGEENTRLAAMIVGRVDSMMVKNGYPLSNEIQIDFDWTASNRKEYFDFLEQMADSLHTHNRKLSTTIRLHQLRQPPPPADYGVLMVYNTGFIASPEETNSILSTASVYPYLKYLDGYRLPLATALPLYSWDLLFRHDRFMVIARGLDHQDTAAFRHLEANRYVARQYMAVPSSSGASGAGVRVLPGDILRHEEAPYELLDSVVNAIRDVRPNALNRVILHHLDNNCIENYSTHEIKKIYSSC